MSAIILVFFGSLLHFGSFLADAGATFVSAQQTAGEINLIVNEFNSTMNEFHWKIPIRIDPKCDGYVARCGFPGEECSSVLNPTCFELPKQYLK